MSEWLLDGARKDSQSVTADWQPVGRALIDGVIVRESRVVPKRNGLVTEVFRDDWFDQDARAGQVFIVQLDVGGLSAWHAHAETLDRLSVIDGAATLVLYDRRPGSPTHGLLNEFHLTARRPTTIVVPPRVWHGVRNNGDSPCLLANIPDRPYRYEDPDHWRVPSNTPSIPYRFVPDRGEAV
jgi:dTDP-4-dehydrorhamnose 3,5-epimerase